MSNEPAQPTTDAWAVCQAETLAENLERIDRAIFYYPRELHTAGKVRMAIMETIRELKQQAGVCIDALSWQAHEDECERAAVALINERKRRA
jgi:hypothetical protein